jgi:hypothetical protein
MAARLYRFCLRLTPAAVLGTTEPVVRQQLRTALGAAGWKEHDHDGSWNAVPVRV